MNDSSAHDDVTRTAPDGVDEPTRTPEDRRDQLDWYGSPSRDAGANPSGKAHARRGGSDVTRGVLVAAGAAALSVMSFVAVSALLHHGAATDSAATRSSASSSASAGTFPSNTVTTCTSYNSGTRKDDVVESTIADNVRMKQGAATSCGFLGATRNEVLAHLQSAPGANTFTVSPFSGRLNKNIPLECALRGSFTFCKGGNDVNLWVRNP